MTDLPLARALDERLVNAWPSFEMELAGGWLLRFAEGYSKRANSAAPVVPGARLDADLVAHVARSYEARGLRPCFRLTGLEDPSAALVLAEAGFVEHDPSLCLTAPIGPADPLAGGEQDDAITIRPTPKPDWIASAAAAYGGDKADRDKLGRILRLIRQPAAFATLEMDGEAVAWGVAVAERGAVGLYDIVVAPALRGMGLGRRLVTSLMEWGREAGATTAYLQVAEANAVAVALYGTLGFATAYRYVYRVPAEARDGQRTVATSAPDAMSRQDSASASDGSA